MVTWTRLNATLCVHCLCYWRNNISHCCRKSSSSQWKHSSWYVCIPTLHCQYKGSPRSAQEMCLSEGDIICMRLWLIPRRRWWFSTTSRIASHQISLCAGLSPHHTNPFNLFRQLQLPTFSVNKDIHRLISPGMLSAKWAGAGEEKCPYAGVSVKCLWKSTFHKRQPIKFSLLIPLYDLQYLQYNTFAIPR